MVRPRPALVEALRLLQDGEWHNRDRILAAVMTSGLIHTGKAAREAERSRAKQYRGLNGEPPPPRKRPIPLQDEVLSGKRSMAREAVRRRRWMEIDWQGDPPVKVVRVLRDKVPSWYWILVQERERHLKELENEELASEASG